MARIKRSVNSIKKRRKVLRLAKGYFGAKSKQYRAASQQVMKSMAYAYVGRKNKKREYRRLWIARINAGARLCGTNYSNLINGLTIRFRIVRNVKTASVPTMSKTADVRTAVQRN